jgi:hypothetical protein
VEEDIRASDLDFAPRLQSLAMRLRTGPPMQAKPTDLPVRQNLSSPHLKNISLRKNPKSWT